MPDTEHAHTHEDCLRFRLAGDHWCTHQTEPEHTLTLEVGLAGGYTSELYRMRTMPHLYDERTVDATITDAYTLARLDDALLVDCHRCRATVHVHPDTDGNVRCPICNTDPTGE